MLYDSAYLGKIIETKSGVWNEGCQGLGGGRTVVSI